MPCSNCTTEEECRRCILNQSAPMFDGLGALAARAGEKGVIPQPRAVAFHNLIAAAQALFYEALRG